MNEINTNPEVPSNVVDLVAVRGALAARDSDYKTEEQASVPQFIQEVPDGMLAQRKPSLSPVPTLIDEAPGMDEPTATLPSRRVEVVSSPGDPDHEKLLDERNARVERNLAEQALVGFNNAPVNPDEPA
ncbi:MAG: hypothetical protein ABI354_03225 [Candidatus Saccharimonadales bacterium]